MKDLFPVQDHSGSPLQSIRYRQPSRTPRTPRGGAWIETTCQRDATYGPILASAPVQFQSTRPHKGRDRERSWRPRSFHVSIHAPPRGARPSASSRFSSIRSFQSTRPHEGRDSTWPAVVSSRTSFNPRAPTRGATAPLKICYRAEFVSIHAPPRGARHCAGVYRQGGRMFQSTRPHEGRDGQEIQAMLLAVGFNPRAPTRGATGGSVPRSAAGTVSIHAPPRGARKLSFAGFHRIRFNPRAPTRGATHPVFRLARFRLVSIHAPPRGARLRLQRLRVESMCFNPRAPTRGATPLRLLPTLPGSVSIHAPPRGARLMYRCPTGRLVMFQSTRPHEGRDPSSRTRRQSSRCFNPRAPTRGATIPES